MAFRMIVFCFAVGFSALTASAGFHDASDLEKVKDSLAKWQTTKADVGNTYSYMVRWSSFIEYGHETRIFVKNGKVVRRTFRPVAVAENPSGEPPFEKWKEDGDQIGKHSEGAPAKTLDQLYKFAIKVASKELEPSERRYVKTDNRGLLIECFIVDTRIADDAPKNGLSITSIRLPRSGNGAAAKRKKAIRLTSKDNGKTIAVTLGQKIQIQLDSNPTTGFSWVDQSKSKSVRLIGEIKYAASGDAIGSGGVSTASFMSTQPGKSEIKLGYLRTFEDKPAAKQFQVTLQIKKANEKDLGEVDKPIFKSPNGKPYPQHWGAPPKLQTRDLRPLPGGYGQGSGTLVKWISENLARDEKAKNNK
ncbi:MAG: protease inhibitor I42 family protein [Mariniblastus sp.]|nr:protease inhibitor I42 family protein [Mariniblastus sp.]